MSSLPIVAVTAAVRRDEAPPVVRLRGTYVAALENARLVPVVAPPAPSEHAARALLHRMDGLVLTGGEDVDPAHYGAAPHPRLGRVAPDRDAWEIDLVHAAREARVPVLAICRGVQVLNVALGGTLVQDLPSERPGAIDHDPDASRASRTHGIDVAPESRVARALGATVLDVNSVHHQAPDRPADALRVTARASDGSIEALESPDPTWWCVGVQWHPEDLVDASSAPDVGLFTAFADAVRRRAAARLPVA